MMIHPEGYIDMIEDKSYENLLKERDALLMKIRETLVDTDEYGAEPTVPDGISIYPYNQLYFWFRFCDR